MAQSNNIVTIVPARLASNRLPGKLLRSVHGRPLLEILLDRLRLARYAGAIVVAATINQEDDAIARLCWKLGFPCYRGDPDDVLDRTYRAARQYDAATIVTIPANCPLIDPAVVDRVIAAAIARPNAFDYISNLHPPTYPDGNDVEIISLQALHDAWRHAWRGYQREHITPYIWENPRQFRLHNITMPGRRNLSRTYRWAVDYPRDLLLVQAIYGALQPHNPHFTLQDILTLLQREPHLAAANAAHAGASHHRHQFPIPHL